MPRRYRAAWVFPVEQAPIANAVVAVDGERIAAVGPASRLGFDEDLGDAALLPGLVNAHVHLDLTNLRGKLAPPGADPTLWLEQVIAHRRAAAEADNEAAVRAGVAECVANGTTCVGDIDGCGVSSRLLPETPLRGVAFRELIGLTEEAAERAKRLWDNGPHPDPPPSTGEGVSSRVRFGLSPHAPYSVREGLLSWAATQGAPLVMHLAEFQEEKALLETRRGPLRSFLEGLGVYDEGGLVRDWATAIDLAQLSFGPGGKRAKPVIFAHGNYLPPASYQQLRGGTTAYALAVGRDAGVGASELGTASVVYCPRTHAYFRHPPHPFREMLAAGINVALGTDGLSSNPDLSLFKEMQFLWHRHGDEVKGETLLEMGTRNGARALGLGAEVGTLTPGKQADVIAIALEKTAGADDYRLLLDSAGQVRLTLIGGDVVRPPGS